MGTTDGRCGRALHAGHRLASYTILELLGVGGMGEVYRAHDTRLERDVAIKVLPRTLVNDEPHLALFNREAKPTRHFSTN